MFKKKKTAEPRFVSILYSEDEYIAIYQLGRHIFQKSYKIGQDMEWGFCGQFAVIEMERTALGIHLMDIGRGLT